MPADDRPEAILGKLEEVGRRGPSLEPVGGVSRRRLVAATVAGIVAVDISFLVFGMDGVIVTVASTMILVALGSVVTRVASRLRPD